MHPVRQALYFSILGAEGQGEALYYARLKWNRTEVAPSRDALPHGESYHQKRPAEVGQCPGCHEED